MKALVYHGTHDIRLETLPDPTPPGTDGAVVKIERTAICGSDLHIYHGNLSSEGGFSVGHECIGEVVEAGSGVRGFRAGDRVLVAGVVGCGLCRPCLSGKVTSCEGAGFAVYGTNQGLQGGQAEALAVPNADHSLRKIPEGVSVEQAVLLTDILPTGYMGAQDAHILPGHDVAIIGMGPVGLMALLSARLFGPARIFALDSVPERLAAAERLGAIPCDIAQDAHARIMDATGGLGVHSVIEAVGADASIQSALTLVRRRGHVSVIGVNTNLAFPFPMALALMQGIHFHIGVCPVPEYWPRLVPLLEQGMLQPDFVFTHRLGLSEGAKAYEIFAARRDGVLKILLDPSA